MAHPLILIVIHMTRAFKLLVFSDRYLFHLMFRTQNPLHYTLHHIVLLRQSAFEVKKHDSLEFGCPLHYKIENCKKNANCNLVAKY
jgi:hypothetical protein